MANAITSVASNASLGYEVIWKPLIENPKINSLPFTIHLGKIGRDLYFDSEFTGEPTVKADCGWTFQTGNSITKKNLNPFELDFSFEQCYVPLLKSIFGDQLPDGWRKGELSPEVIDRIVTKQSNAFNTNLLYTTFLSDTTSSTPFLAEIDGVYAALKAGEVANDGTVDAGAITDNDLLPANIEETMYGIVSSQSQLLKGFDNGSKVLIVTQTVYEAWARFLQVGNGTAFQYANADAIRNGVADVRYLGIPMINASYVDTGLSLYETSGSPAAVTNPHRVILTIGNNHHIMIDGTGFEAIEPFYDRKDDKVYSPASAMVDYKYGYGELNVFAGF